MSKEYDEEWQTLEKITTANIEKWEMKRFKKKMENEEKLIGLWNAW